MVEHIGRSIQAMRMEKFKQTRCPQDYCRHEFREENRRNQY